MRRSLIEGFDVVGPLIYEVKSYYLGEIWIAEAQYFAVGRPTESYTYYHESSEYLKLEIDLRQTKKGRRSLVKMRKDAGAVETKLMFALDEDNDITSLKSIMTFGDHWPKRYVCFYEGKEDKELVKRMRETIDDKIYLTIVEVEYYKEKYWTDEAPNAIEEYLGSRLFPPFYKPQRWENKVKQYYWIEGRIKEEGYGYNMDFRSVLPSLFIGRYVYSLQIEGARQEKITKHYITAIEDLHPSSNAWLVAGTELDDPIDDFSVPSIELPSQEAYYELFYSPWFEYLSAPDSYSDRKIQEEKYAAKCRFWEQMQRLAPDYYVYEGDVIFSLVSKDESLIEQFLKNCSYEIEYRRGIHTF